MPNRQNQQKDAEYWSTPKQVDRLQLESHEHWKDLPGDSRSSLIKMIETGAIAEAVKFFRAETGLGLGDSLAAIDAVTGGAPDVADAVHTIPLTRATDIRLRRVFDSSLHEEATRILKELAGPSSGLSDTPEGLERVRFAALKASGGTIKGLRNAIELAYTDWRDLLVSADFAHDATAHERWLAEKRWWQFWK
jgi:hypothetical protein